jgi:hypothetical protein
MINVVRKSNVKGRCLGDRKFSVIFSLIKFNDNEENENPPDCCFAICFHSMLNGKYHLTRKITRSAPIKINDNNNSRLFSDV